MQPYGNDHRVRAPSMYFTHDSERDLFAKIADVDVCVLQRRAVIEHEQQARERENEKQKKCDAAHAPRVAHAYPGFADLYRVQVKKNAAQHHEHAFAVRVRYTDAEDGSIDLTILDVLSDPRRGQGFELLLEPICEITHIFSDEVF